MKRRTEKKRANRERRNDRLTLVHKAGCTFRTCNQYLDGFDIAMMSAAAYPHVLRVPRSMRGGAR